MHLRPWHTELLVCPLTVKVSPRAGKSPGHAKHRYQHRRRQRAAGAALVPGPPCPGCVLLSSRLAGWKVSVKDWPFFVESKSTWFDVLPGQHEKTGIKIDVVICSLTHSCSKRVCSSSCSRPEAQRESQNSQRQVFRNLPQRQQQGVPGLPGAVLQDGELAKVSSCPRGM